MKLRTAPLRLSPHRITSTDALQRVGLTPDFDVVALRHQILMSRREVGLLGVSMPMLITVPTLYTPVPHSRFANKIDLL